MGNSLYYGDNLWALQEHVADHSVDLIYLDPPFNSNAQYNVLFKTPEGEASGAQAEAFQDTWHWGELSEKSFDAMMAEGGHAAEILRSLRSFLGTSDMMAYLANMAIRLHEMHRTLKQTGSLYLHCDPTASHYLKILLDGIFGSDMFRNELIWQRATPKGLAFTRFPSNHDVIFFYSKTDKNIWNSQFVPHREAYIESHYGSVEPETGRRYQLTSLLNPNKNRPNLTYEFPPGSGTVRVWRWKKERMMEAWKSGRVVVPNGGVARYKRYLDEMKGAPVTSVWTDIAPVNSQAKERIGYPTQKPLALLERVISASSPEGGVVLDPFCGCGTTVHAAQTLKRSWIGVDVAHYAVGVIEDRLREEFGPQLKFTVEGRPTSIDGAQELAKRDKYQFQWWANWLVGVQNYRERRKGADSGIDGIIYFRNGPMGTGRVVVSVKGGENVGPDMVRALGGTVDREKAELGLLVCLAEPTANMRREAAALGFCKTAHGTFPRVQIATVEDLLAGKKPNLPPRYEVSDDELLMRKSRPRADDPQLGFTFAISGDKDAKTYPAERYIARAWKHANQSHGASTGS